MSIASEITRLQGAKATLKTKLNARNDNNHQITTETLEDYGNFVDSIPQGSGDIVNGIIDQYKAETSTIDANTFVEFVNKTTIDSIGSDTLLVSVKWAGQYTSAVALNNNKVFVAHRGNSSYLYGVICEINGNSITPGTDTQLSAENGVYSSYAITKLTEDKVFIACKYGSYDLGGMICSINGTTITTSEITTLVDGTSSRTTVYNNVSIATLNNNKIFISHYNSSSLYGIICEINNNTITVGTDTSITYNYNGSKVITLSNDKVLVATKSGSYNLGGVVCSISGTTITIGTFATIATGNSSYSAYSNTSLVKLTENKVFVAYPRNAYLGGVVCTISGDTITTGTDISLTSNSNSQSYISAVALNSTQVFVAHNQGKDSTSTYLSGVVCSINGTEIVAGTDTRFSNQTQIGQYISAVNLENGKVFIAHQSDNSSYYLKGIICNISPNTIKEASSKIDALTKTECTTSTAGDVWVLGE